MFTISKKITSKIWRIINSITHRKKQENQFPHQLDINENSNTKPVEIVDKLNTHFANIGLQTCTKKRDTLNSANKIKNVSISFLWLDVRETEVFNTIKSLDPKKAIGEDYISVKILKKVNNLISPLLSKLINQAFYEGVYPSSLKLSKVIPIFKSGLKTLPGKNRPISV